MEDAKRSLERAKESARSKLGDGKDVFATARDSAATRASRSAAGVLAEIQRKEAAQAEAKRIQREKDEADRRKAEEAIRRGKELSKRQKEEEANKRKAEEEEEARRVQAALNQSTAAKESAKSTTAEAKPQGNESSVSRIPAKLEITAGMADKIQGLAPKLCWYSAKDNSAYLVDFLDGTSDQPKAWKNQELVGKLDEMK